MFNRKNKPESFWKWFIKNSDRLESLATESAERSLLEELDKNIKGYCKDLVWEIGRGESSKFELVISAGGYTEFFPMVERLIQAAPKISEWEFTAFKQSGDIDVSVQLNGKEYKIDDFWFCFTGEDQNGLIVLHSDIDDPAIETAAILLLDNAVGEYDAATKINRFGVDRLPEDPENYRIEPMRKIKERFYNR